MVWKALMPIRDVMLLSEGERIERVVEVVAVLRVELAVQ